MKFRAKPVASAGVAWLNRYCLHYRKRRIQPISENKCKYIRYTEITHFFDHIGTLKKVHHGFSYSFTCVPALHAMKGNQIWTKLEWPCMPLAKELVSRHSKIWQAIGIRPHNSRKSYAPNNNLGMIVSLASHGISWKAMSQRMIVSKKDKKDNKNRNRTF